MAAITHEKLSNVGRFAVTPTDSILVEILGELRAIHDHLDAEERNLAASTKENTPKAHVEPRVSAAKPAKAPPTPKRAGSSK